MKRLSILLLFVCSLCYSKAQSEPCTFVEAKPVWSEGREKEQNLTLAFREVVELRRVKSSTIRLTASCDYRLRVNGAFVAHGPCVAAHDFYRIDSYDLKPYLKSGKNIIAIEVAGYNMPSYYLLDQPSFLQAEVEVNGNIVAATGHSFLAYDLHQRVQDVPKFSFQRPHTESYILTPDYAQWVTDLNWKATVAAEKLVEQEHKTLLARGVAYPDYRLHAATMIGKNLYKFATNSSGFLRAKLLVKRPCKLELRFDELLNDKGRVANNRLRWKPYILYDLQAGEYDLDAFEPYTMQYVEVIAEEGALEVKEISMRDYCNYDCHRAKFESNSQAINTIFEAARENFRQNILDIYMDCPGRERAGWLGDSYFTGRVEFGLTGRSRVERNFIENYLLPEEFKDIDKGMLPMCYPADHRNHNYIPNWAMWFVLEMEEYLKRTGDRATIERARTRIYNVVDYFTKYLNEDGLLEKLDKWVFVDYSFSNKCVQDISYPSNMLYAEMLDVVARLYGDKALANQAAHIRKVVLEQSFNGEFFVDNALRGENGERQLTNNITEACQYYAFFCGVATPQSHPELWRKLRDDFHPKKRKAGSYANVHAANVFIGNFLRFELLSRYGLNEQLIEEAVDLYMPMVELTGTIWEFFKPKASCNHGFGSYLTHIFYRDALGVYEVLPCERKVRLRFVDSGLEWCKGSIPVGDEAIAVEWRFADGKFNVNLDLPRGYTYELMPSNCRIAIR